jgi:tyrosine decarboxylase/aspartate 1-decarboxylase
MEELWPDGYEAQYRRSQANAEWLAAEARARGADVVSPVLPIVSLDLPSDIVADLTDRGWRLSRTAADEARVVCMPHVTRPMLEAFLADLDDLAGPTRATVEAASTEPPTRRPC